MPVRDSTRPAEVKTSYGSTPATSKVLGALGYYQRIDALNYGARPLPNVWVCKPVTIEKSLATSHPLGTETATYNKVAYSIEGDVAAQLMALKGYIPPWTWMPKPAWSQTRANEAVNKAYAKIMATDLDVGVMIGELKETLEGLRNPLSALRKYFGPVRYIPKRVNTKRELKALTRMLSSTWLEWRYGIKPLYQTIMDIYEHVNSELTGFNDKMQRKRGRAPEATTTTTVTENIQVGSWQVQCNVATTTTTRYGASVGYKLTSPLTFEERYGLDLYALPGIIWELTTLSFVVDWWLNVGQWLDSLRTLNPKVQLLGLSTSMKTTVETETTTTGRAWIGGQPRNLTGTGAASFKYERLVRTCSNTAFPGVTPAVNTNALGLQREIDSLSLLWQRFAKGR